MVAWICPATIMSRNCFSAAAASGKYTISAMDGNERVRYVSVSVRMSRPMSAETHCFASPKLWSEAKAAACFSRTARNSTGLPVAKASENSVYGPSWFLMGRVMVGDVYFGSFGASPVSIREHSRHLGNTCARMEETQDRHRTRNIVVLSCHRVVVCSA